MELNNWVKPPEPEACGDLAGGGVTSGSDLEAVACCEPNNWVKPETGSGAAIGAETGEAAGVILAGSIAAVCGAVACRVLNNWVKPPEPGALLLARGASGGGAGAGAGCCASSRFKSESMPSSAAAGGTAAALLLASARSFEIMRRRSSVSGSPCAGSLNTTL